MALGADTVQARFCLPRPTNCDRRTQCVQLWTICSISCHEFFKISTNPKEYTWLYRRLCQKNLRNKKIHSFMVRNISSNLKLYFQFAFQFALRSFCLEFFQIISCNLFRDFSSESTIQQRYVCRQYTTEDANSIVEDSATIAGDPLQHDLITMFGNDGSHWYSILIDNRPTIKKVNKR